MGTALLTTFLTRTQQTHQSTLAAHFIPGSIAYENFSGPDQERLDGGGAISPTQAKAAATGYAYQQLLRQSSMLSYQNAFLGA